MNPMLLALLPRPPHPTRDGGSIRAWNLLRGLADAYRVRAFVLRAPGSAGGEYPAGVEVREIPHGRRLVRRGAAAMRSLIGPRAYSELLYRSARLSKEVRAAVRGEAPDWVVALSYQLGPVAMAQGVSSWIDFQNIDSEIWKRIGQTAASPFTRTFARGQVSRVAALERRLASGASGISCVSDRDAQTLAAMAPGAQPFVVWNGVDLGRYRFRAGAPADPVVFFVGDLSWPPNAEGLRWFRDRVWPLVRQRRPGARVEVLGRGAPAGLLAGAAPDFRLLGEGGDTRPHWQGAAVSIVPLQAGGGTRLKILEAAACGVPVVSTPVGAEGLDLEPGAEIAIATDAASFAQEVSRLLADPEAGRRQAEAARRRVEAVSDWGPIGASLARELRRRKPSA